VLVARRFVFFDFNLKAEALILAPLGLRWPRVRGNEKWRKRSSLSTRFPILTQTIQDEPRHCRAWRKTEITCDKPTPTILLAAGDSDVLSTIREQKHLLHHRSHCRYCHRPQSAPRLLAPTLLYFTARKPLCARDWCCLRVCFLDRYGIRRHFLGVEELSCGARATCRAFARSRTVDDR